MLSEFWARRRVEIRMHAGLTATPHLWENSINAVAGLFVSFYYCCRFDTVLKNEYNITWGLCQLRRPMQMFRMVTSVTDVDAPA